jgi:UDP-glucuronate 4-epimerase
MKKVLITGGAGFIGSNLASKLLKKGYFVVAFDNLNDYYNPAWKLKNLAKFKENKNFKFVKGDILDEKTLDKLFKKHNFDYVVHLAARAGVRPSIADPKLYEEVNVRGTLNILEACRVYKVKKLVSASSSSVYGNQSKIPFSETDRVNNPISPYAATKKAGEEICYTYSHLYKIPVVCLRFFTVYGPNGRPDMAPYLFVEAIMKGKPIKKFGDGTTSRDYTYVEDITDGIYAAMLYKCDYEIFNLGNSNPVTLNKFISNLEKIIGKNAVIESAPMQPGDVEKTYADTKKAKKLLKYNPKTNFYDGLTKLVEWYKEERI